MSTHRLRAQADAHFDAQRYAQAVPLYEAALRRGVQSDGATPSTDTAHVLHFLGYSHYRLGNYEAASPLLKRVLAIEVYHVALRIDVSLSLASAYRLTSQLPLAAAHAEATRHMIDAADAAGHLTATQCAAARADVFSEIATNFAYEGRPSDALLNLEPALELYESLGDNDGMRKVLCQMSRVQSVQGLHELALATARKAEALDRNDVVVLNRVGNCLSNLGRHEEDLAYKRRELAIEEKKYGKRSEGAAESMRNLGTALCKAGHIEEGIATMRQASTTMEELRLTETLDYADCCYNLGFYLMNDSKLTEALTHLTRALEIYRRLLPPDHPGIAQCLKDLSDVNERLGNADAAALAAAASASVARRSQTACAGPGCTRTVMENGRPLEQCGKCRRTYYCSVGCQTADWKREGGHKAECKALVAEGLDPESGLKPLKPQS